MLDKMPVAKLRLKPVVKGQKEAGSGKGAGA